MLFSHILRSVNCSLYIYIDISMLLSGNPPYPSVQVASTINLRCDEFLDWAYHNPSCNSTYNYQLGLASG